MVDYMEARFWRTNIATSHTAGGLKIRACALLQNHKIYAEFYFTAKPLHSRKQATCMYRNSFSSIKNITSLRLKPQNGSALLESIVAISLITLVLFTSNRFALTFFNIFAKSNVHFKNAIRRTDWQSTIPNNANCQSISKNSSYELLDCRYSDSQMRTNDIIVRDVSK